MANPNATKYDYLLERNQGYMDYIALTSPLSDRKITYEELHDRIEKYVKLLYAKGIRRGDKIGVCVVNTPESIYLLYALDIIGAIVVGLSPLDNKEKIKQDLLIARPKMVITVDMAYSNVKDFEKALNFSTMLYSPLESCDKRIKKVAYSLMQLKQGNFKLSRSSNLHPLLGQDYSTITVPDSLFTVNKVSDIIFTGGSTGIHKGVMLSSEGLNHMVEGMDTIFTEAEPGMVHLGNIPIGHMVFGRMIMHYSLCNNLELALSLKAMPKDFYDELVRTHSTAAVGGPPHWVSLVEKQGDIFVPNSRLKKNSLKGLKFATSGGEAKKENTTNAINTALEYCGSDARLGDGLGATETWSSITVNNGRRDTQGTVGRKLGNIDIKLIDQKTGLESDEGILYVSGPTTMLGYYQNQEETEKVISYDENGKKWINLGDILRRLPNGEYEYIGREKRNFVSGVENIYPEQLEELLSTIPEIREVVVTPISDEIMQFIPRYHIVLYTENTDITALESKIKRLVEEKLSPSWLPGYIEYSLEPLVRMANTKIDVGYYKQKDITDAESGNLNYCPFGGKQMKMKPQKK